MQDVVKKERSSNLELFRIITMLLIVAHHYVVNSGLMNESGVLYTNLWSAKSIFLLLFGAWGKTGINCFVLITGYFMCRSQITAKKFVKLFFELEFYKIVIYFVFLLTGYSTFSLKGFVKAVLPFTSISQNFPGCFLVFFLLIPFLNILIKNMTEKQHIRLLTLLAFIFIGLGTVLGAAIQMNYVTWFVVLYLISSYVRIYPKKIFDNTLFWGIASIVIIAVSSLSVVALSYAVSNGYGVWPHMLVADSNKIFAVLTSFCGFMFFKNVKIKQSKFINTVAASAFGVLLIHANSDTMRQWLWVDFLKNVETYSSKYMVLHAIGSVVAIYVICTLIDYLRIQLIEKPFFKLWDKHWDKVSSKFSTVEASICEKLKIEAK